MLTADQLDEMAGLLDADDRHDHHFAGQDFDEACPAFTPPPVEPTP